MSNIQKSHQTNAVQTAARVNKPEQKQKASVKAEQIMEAPETLRQEDVMAAQQQLGNQVVQRALDHVTVMGTRMSGVISTQKYPRPFSKCAVTAALCRMRSKRKLEKSLDALSITCASMWMTRPTCSAAAFMRAPLRSAAISSSRTGSSRPAAARAAKR
jgi:hypothetical protein